MDAKKRKKLVANKLRIRRERQRKAEAKEKSKTAIYLRYPNGKNIHELMTEAGFVGDVRDYMILVGDRMVDYKDSYAMVVKTGGKLSVGDDDIRVMHKKKLKNVIGEEAARRFWHPTIGRLVDTKPGTKPSKKIKK